MPTLDAAAGTALEKLKELLPHVEQSEGDYGRAAQAVQRAVRSADEAWQEVASEAASFREREARRREALAAEREVRVERVEALTGRLEEMERDVRDRARDALDELRDLHESSDEIAEEVQELLERLDQAAESFAGRADALAQRFEDAMDGLERFLETEVTADLEKVQDAIEEGCRSLGSRLSGECASLVDQAAQRAEERLEGSAHVLERVLADTCEQVELNVRDVMDRCGGRFAQARERVEDLARQAEAALEGLGEVVDETAGGIREHEGPLAEAAAQVADAVRAVHEGVDGRLDFFARFTFI